jgi:hypothetical protein
MIQAEEIDNLKAIDAYWRAALHILQKLFPDYPGVWSFVSVKRREIHFREMLDSAGWSSGEYLALQAAANLFNGENPTPALDDLCSVLDRKHFMTVVEAMLIRAGGR